MTRDPDSPDKGIGTALDGCSWDYTAPKPVRRFFLNPMSSFFGDFPWEGLKNTSPTPANSKTIAESATDSTPDSID